MSDGVLVPAKKRQLAAGLGLMGFCVGVHAERSKGEAEKGLR